MTTRDTVAGMIAAVGMSLLIWLGSNQLYNFDSALVGYAVAIVALTFAIVARYSRWLALPATRRYWRRGWQLFASWRNFRRLPSLLPRAVGGQLLGQGFIRRRGLLRWIGHQCLFWGVMGATAITFPLVFGWLVFQLEPGTEQTYRMFVFGYPTFTFDSGSFLGWSLFHSLNYTAVLVIIGCAIFLWRRLRDRRVIVNQRLGYDMLPLLMLLVISVTGMLLTISAMFFAGAYYDFLVVLHMASVVLALVFIPFGKFFHVVQRPASVGIQMYTEINGATDPVPCTRCGAPLASPMLLSDLQATLDELGQDYRLAAPAGVAGAVSAAGAAGAGSAAGAAVDHPAGRAPAAAAHLVELCPRCKRVVRGQAYFDANGPG
ncbi:MAG TPA: hypothetical protein VK891_03885, partial [Euzebyales bacterium]|nr:hypothetical protein [Euzebyales bacterium]